MLYLLKNDDKQAPWQIQYENLFERELSTCGASHATIRIDNVRTLNKEDIVWVMHYKDLHTPEVKETPARVMSHANATTANPYIYQLGMDEEAEEMKDIVDIVLTFSKRQTEAMKTLYPDKQYIDVGFPIEVPELNLPKIAKTVLVPGRISPDKQFYMTAFLLTPLIKKGYEVTFCVQMNEKNKYWLDYYDKKKFERLGFKFLFCDRGTYLAQAAISQYVFSASLGDVMQVSLAEACMSGCYPVIPAFREGLPCYDEYISNGYEPFSQKEIIRIFESRPHLSFEAWHFAPVTCTNRLLKGLKL